MVPAWDVNRQLLLSGFMAPSQYQRFFYLFMFNIIPLDSRNVKAFRQFSPAVREKFSSISSAANGHPARTTTGSAKNSRSACPAPRESILSVLFQVFLEICNRHRLCEVVALEHIAVHLRQHFELFFCFNALCEGHDVKVG